MNRITSSAGRAGEVLRAAPVAESRRTLALCLACLVPGSDRPGGSDVRLPVLDVRPAGAEISWGEFTDPELAAIMACGVLAAVGGPLLGVLTARWWRWPTAAAVTACC